MAGLLPFNVFVGSLTSEMGIISYGIRQGSALGPIKFILNMIPLGKLISKLSHLSYYFCMNDIQLYFSFPEKKDNSLSNFFDCLTSIKSWMVSNSFILEWSEDR